MADSLGATTQCFNLLRAGFITPSVISGNSLRPDLLLTVSKKCLYILELIVGFETNLNTSRKTRKYEDMIRLQQNQFDSVKFISLSISTLGVFSNQSSDFLNMLKETGFDEKHIKYIIKTLTDIAIVTLELAWVNSVPCVAGSTNEKAMLSFSNKYVYTKRTKLKN